MTQPIDYEIISGEQENELVKELKALLKSVVLDNGYYSGIEKPNYIAKYALLELAAEIAWRNGNMDAFIEGAQEVVDMFAKDTNRFIND